MDKSKKLSIIIYSCWKNRDMWEIFSILFEKYWSDCKYNVILVTDKFEYSENKFVFDKIIKNDDTWGNMILNAVNESETQYVMLWMDDYLLCDYISNEDIERQILRAEKYNVANLRLVESPKCIKNYLNTEYIGYYQKGEAYSLSTQVGIWDANFLKNIIQKKWSAWDFERIASLQKDSSQQPLLVSLDYVFPYEEGVRKGKWMQQGAKLCERNGIKLDVQKRPIMTNFDMAKIYFQGAILDWNAKLIVKWQNAINRFKGQMTC